MKICNFIFLLSIYLIHLSSCAYRQGAPERVMPGGYKWVKVPIFKNYTQEPGTEVFFTNSMIDELQKSKIATVVDNSDIVVEGAIESISYTPTSIKYEKDDKTQTLPIGAVQATDYRIVVVTTISLVRKSDQSILWSSKFDGERTYTAPQISGAIVNSANPLYNLSARRSGLKEIANDMASEAIDRMTENF